MIRAIPTTYRGVRFASSLEADWARTLDGLGMVWQYEPEGVKLPSGKNYRPDLYLPAVSTWVEVKGPHNQRITKPGELASACLHAPGCSGGSPVDVLLRPATAPGATCACGHGLDFPWRLVVVLRPATGARAVFEPARGMGRDQHLAVMTCPVCAQRSFTDVTGAPICRRCHQDASGAQCTPSKGFKFLRVEVPRGRKKSARRPSRAKTTHPHL